MNLSSIIKLTKLGIKSRAIQHPLLKTPERLKNLIFGSPLKDSSPSMLQIELTSNCNLACAYCTQHASKKLPQVVNKDEGEMKFDTFVSILDRHPAAAYLQLQGQGEPLLHPDFSKFTSEAKARGMVVLTVSNGITLTTPKRKELFESGLDVLAVSLDIAEPEEMETMRVGMNYARVIDQFQRTIKERDAGGYRILVGISAVLTKGNVPILESIVRRYDGELLPDFINISPLASVEGTPNDYLALYPDSIRGQTLNRQITLPELKGVSSVVTFCPSLNYGEKEGCIQTKAVYYRSDGTTAYCAVRHKVDAEDPVKEMQKAATLMSKNTVPPGCSNCHYLPDKLGND